MSDAHEPTPGTIKITDRRRFTPEGAAREGAKRTREVPATTPPVEAATEAPTPEPKQVAADEPPLRIELLPFVASLASNALSALGAVPEGQEHSVPVNPSVAREYIDIIVMLERKTRGNVSADEAKTLQQIVGDLRLHFLEATQGGPAPR